MTGKYLPKSAQPGTFKAWPMSGGLRPSVAAFNLNCSQCKLGSSVSLTSAEEEGILPSCRRSIFLIPQGQQMQAHFVCACSEAVDRAELEVTCAAPRRPAAGMNPSQIFLLVPWCSAVNSIEAASDNILCLVYDTLVQRHSLAGAGLFSSGPPDRLCEVSHINGVSNCAQVNSRRSLLVSLPLL